MDKYRYMRAREFITETTTAGGIASVAMPMGTVVKREVDEDLKNGSAKNG